MNLNNTNKKNHLLQPLSLYLLATAACLAITMPALSGYFWSYQGGLAACLWLLLPSIVIMNRREDFSAYGITIRGSGRGAVPVSAVSLISLAGFAAAYYVYRVYHAGGQFRFDPPAGWFSLAVYQAAVISLPEEYFFRGYLQTEFNRYFVRRWNILGAKAGYGLLLTAFLFALSHAAIDRNMMRLNVFIPALLFGWMRERSGAIVAPLLYHAACNITLITLQSSSISG